MPSWRFFDRPGWIPRLEIRIDQNDWAPWQPVFKRNLFTFFRNGPGNLTLAKISLLERLMEEAPRAETPEAFSQSTTFRLTKALARDVALEMDPRAHSYQFRIRIVSQLEPDREHEDLLISSEYEVDHEC